MEVRCSLIIKGPDGQKTQEDCILAWVPRAGERIIRKGTPVLWWLNVERLNDARIPH